MGKIYYVPYITQEQRQERREVAHRMRADGLTFQQIAEVLDCNKTTARRYVLDRTAQLEGGES
jgi:uncharacterized membrane protein